MNSIADFVPLVNMVLLIVLCVVVLRTKKG